MLPDLSTDSSDVAEKTQIHKGPEGFLDNVKEELIEFITEWRDRGLPVSRFSVLQKATQFKPTFAEKSLAARYMCISRFLLANNLVHRIVTHASQKPPEVARDDARSYMKMVVPMCVGRMRDPKFTINMDQTNQFYGSSPKSTINVFTIVLTVTASGGFLTPFIVYKGVKGGTIDTRELPQQPQGACIPSSRRRGLTKR